MKTAVTQAAWMVAAIAALAASPMAAAAQQDCGRTCHSCGFLKLSDEGRDYVGRANGFDMDCRFLSCRRCQLAPNDVGDAGLPAAHALRAIQGASADSLSALVAHYSGRLLLDESRRLLAMRGIGCASDHVTAVVFLSRETTIAVSALIDGRLPAVVAPRPMPGSRSLDLEGGR